MQDTVIKQMLQSWIASDSLITPTEEILRWVDQKNRETHVEIQKISIDEMTDWYYTAKEGTLRNSKGTFFKVSGFRGYENGQIVAEQPILLQQENGYLGIICKEIGGVLHFLMQAKIEPGNVNKIQISPTIQATKSNFTQAHGGRKPAYLEYFLHADRHHVIYDQLQSEQSSRFLKKRNRNLLIQVQDEVEVLPTHRWMTLGQLKELMCTRDNLVNMDTRTVLSGIPFSVGGQRPNLSEENFDQPLIRSIFLGNCDYDIPRVYNYLNNYKMFADRRYELIPLHTLHGWRMDEYGVFPEQSGGFQIIYCAIDIEGREVQHWCQPLFEAIGQSVFGLVSCDIEGVRHFLVQALPEPGCFDGIELGPTIQLDAARNQSDSNGYVRLINDPRSKILCDVILSEEGGRFYHEQNRNLLIHTTRERIGELPQGFFLLDYMTLNRLGQINNCLNIQLRNLLSLLRLKQ